MKLFNLLKITNFLLISIFMIISYSEMSAQKSPSNPLNPEKFQTQRETGVFVGLGQNIQGGAFNTKCNCPQFENGSAFGWKLGLLYEEDIKYYLQWGAAIGINSLGVKASYQYNKDRAFTATVGGTNVIDTVPILFRQEAATNFLNFMIMPYIKWSPAEFFFLRLGFNADFNISSGIIHSEEILQKTVKLPSSGEIVEVTFKDGKSKVIVEDGEFPNVVTPQFYLVPALGFTFSLSKNIFLSPIFDFSIPLSEMSTNGTGFKVSNWRFVVELRWAIQLRQE